MQLRAKVAVAVGALVIASGVGYGVGVTQINQPHMQNALGYLQSAKGELIVAEANKGGHRANAIRLVNEAIGEVQAGINYAY